jgi:hypothetical protein
VIAQLQGHRRSLAVGVGQAMPTATIGVDMAVGVAPVGPSAKLIFTPPFMFIFS